MVILAILRIAGTAGTLILRQFLFAPEDLFIILHWKKLWAVFDGIIARADLIQPMYSLFHQFMHGFLNADSKIIFMKHGYTLVIGRAVLYHPVRIVLQIRPKSTAGRHDRFSCEFIIKNISAKISVFQLPTYKFLVHTQRLNKSIGNHMIPQLRRPFRIRQRKQYFYALRAHLMGQKPRHITRVFNTGFYPAGQFYIRGVDFFV